MTVTTNQAAGGGGGGGGGNTPANDGNNKEQCQTPGSLDTYPTKLSGPSNDNIDAILEEGISQFEFKPGGDCGNQFEKLEHAADACKEIEKYENGLTTVHEEHKRFIAGFRCKHCKGPCPNFDLNYGVDVSKMTAIVANTGLTDAARRDGVQNTGFANKAKERMDECNAAMDPKTFSCASIPRGMKHGKCFPLVVAFWINGKEVEKTFDATRSWCITAGQIKVLIFRHVVKAYGIDATVGQYKFSDYRLILQGFQSNDDLKRKEPEMMPNDCHALAMPWNDPPKGNTISWKSEPRDGGNTGKGRILKLVPAIPSFSDIHYHLTVKDGDLRNADGEKFGKKIDSILEKRRNSGLGFGGVGGCNIPMQPGNAQAAINEVEFQRRRRRRRRLMGKETSLAELGLDANMATYKGPVDPAKGTCGIPTFHRVPQGSNGLYAKLACVDANTKKPLKMVADPDENTKAGYLETAEKIAKATKVTFEHGHVRASFECKDDTCGKLKEECGKMKLFFKVLDGNNNPLVLVTICGLTYNMECKGKANGYKCPGEVQRRRRRRILRFRGGGGS
jgi:hypothetical protein